MPAGQKAKKSEAKPSLRDKMTAAYGAMKAKNGKRSMSCECEKA